MSDEKILTIDDICAAADVEERVVSVPAWGGAVKVRGVTRKEHRDILKWSVDPKTKEIDSDRLEMWLFIKALVSPKVTKADYDRLMAKNSGAVQIVLDAIMELSGLKAAAVEEAEADFREDA